ncbi:metal-sensing transcriptional repressor [Blautia sp. CLA-JM-H16]|uniref:Metal-sensing transcriptional repressor n=1 Tax=Blautia aquisgranensis TaxID=3133153 RepID=A0ABV1BF10_9FIRM
MSDTNETHVHVLEDGTVLRHTHGEHEHDHSSTHPHHHSHAQTKAVLNRLSRAIGHMESIKRMVEDGRDCSEVLIQLSAVKSAINNTGKIILQDHIEHCIVDAVEHGDREAIKELEKAIDRFMK